MRKLDLSQHSWRFLNALPPKQFRQVVTAIFGLLREPFPQDARRLAGFAYHRVDVGEYRVVYRVEPDLVPVALVGKRNGEEVYRQLARMF